MTNLSQVPAQANGSVITIETLQNTEGFGKGNASTVETYLMAAKDLGVDVPIEQAIEKCGLMDRWETCYFKKQALTELDKFRSMLTNEQLSQLRKAMFFGRKSHATLTWELNGQTVQPCGTGKLYNMTKKADQNS